MTAFSEAIVKLPRTGACLN